VPKRVRRCDDAIETAVWLGDRPETVYEPKPNRVNIYLGRTSNPLQIGYSGAHEAFHRVCSPMAGTHWADEMFAVLFSLLYLGAPATPTTRTSIGLICSARRLTMLPGHRRFRPLDVVPRSLAR